eukprot:3817232-Rhodomonas_salina.3
MAVVKENLLHSFAHTPRAEYVVELPDGEWCEGGGGAREEEERGRRRSGRAGAEEGLSLIHISEPTRPRLI